MKGDGCTGKFKHRSHEAACIALRKVKNRVLNVYQCPKCKQWHLGSSRHPYRIQERLDQIFERMKTRPQ